MAVRRTTSSTPQARHSPPTPPKFSWIALLHQARHSITGSAREAFDEADFFYHPEGATRPDLELVATRDAFLASDPERAQSARCRFPARFQLLIERGLLLDVPRGACPELDA